MRQEAMALQEVAQILSVSGPPHHHPASPEEHGCLS